MESPEQVAVSFEVYDMAGRRLMRQDCALEEGANVLRIPVGELPAGVFTATLTGPKGIISRKKITK